MADKFDVIVVGAGPGGSSAALSLARGGAKVLLLDKHNFPRDKPCGDFIGRQAFSLSRKLGVSAHRFEAYPPLAGIKMQTPGARDLVLPGKNQGARARVIPRAVFDTALVELAVEAGANFRKFQVGEVLWVNEQICGVRNRSGEQLLAPLVIGADGWGSIVGRSIGARPNARVSIGLAVRAYFDGVKNLNNMVAFHFPDSILPGYGWIFPVESGGRANVGIGLIAQDYQNSEKLNLNYLFDRFIQQTRSLKDAQITSQRRSWPLALGWQSQKRIAAGGVMLVGDAASLVGPLTGAGIFPAMRSGLLAAETALVALAKADFSLQTLEHYEKKVRNEFRWRLVAEEKAQHWLRDPRRLDWALQNPLHLPTPLSNALTTGLLFNLG